MALRRTNRRATEELGSATRVRVSQSVSYFTELTNWTATQCIEHSNWNTVSKRKERLSIFALLVRWRT